MNPETLPAEITEDVVERANETESKLVAADHFVVENPAQYEDAATFLKNVTAQRKALEEERVNLKAGALETCRRIDAFFKTPRERLDRAIDSVKKVMIEYNDKQEAIAREERRKAEEAARKERERIQKEAAQQEERARIACEKAEAKAAELEAEGRAAEAEAKREAAEEAEAKKQREADRKREMADQIVAIPVTPTAEKTSGISKPKTWDFEIEDENAIPREYLIVDEKAVRGVVKAMKGKTNIPGVRVFQRGGIRALTK